MEERQSRLSNMDWKRFRPYLCVRLIPQNSMFSNFCHILNHESVHPLLDAEAIRVVMKSPKWKPAKKDGKPVRVSYTMPVMFYFRN